MAYVPTVEQALDDIVRKYGPDIIRDSQRTKSLLMDYTRGKHRSTCRLLIYALDDGIGKELLRAINSNSDEKQIALSRCINKFTNSSYLKEDAVKYVATTIAHSLGFNVHKVNICSAANAQYDDIDQFVNADEVTTNDKRACTMLCVITVSFLLLWAFLTWPVATCTTVIFLNNLSMDTKI